MADLKLNRIIAAGVFCVSCAVYMATLAPTVVFWDVGEFIAAAKLLQVPHPPGSPLFLLATRIAMMIPFAADQAVRAHAFSALLSAIAIMFTYLIIVRVIINWRGIPETLLDRLTVHGASAVGALTLAFIPTYWDNSIEAEVYGASMFFFTAVLWLALRWTDRAEEEGNEKYVLLIAYLIGLSLGVHLLALLAIFPVLMIIYFRKYEVNSSTFMKFGLISLVIFFVVYPGIVKWLPGMMDGEFAGKKSDIMAWIPWILIAGVCYGAYTSYKSKSKMVHIALMSILLIFLGYTTYTSVIIRSNANPPMNENDPRNLAKLTSYLGREQYGNSPLFMPRRWSQEPHQAGIYKNYSSDMDYMLRYQLGHMFFRYVGWNFIGAAGDEQDSPVSAKETLAIPLIVGLFGLIYLYRKDRQMAWVLIVTFIILGPVLALYQNQQEPQPRERDYFYVGAYMVFAVWISVGVVALMDFIKKLKKQPGLEQGLATGVLCVAVLAIPGRLAQINYPEHNRSGNYVAWDYSYNMLQSCDKDAILFTNGDNDTFPLWYLQDVEGIRRDVRIVNLSLVNTSWYIKQMKATPYYKEALPVPMTLSDKAIETIQPVIWQTRQLDLPVTPEAIAKYGPPDSTVARTHKITFTMPFTLQVGETRAIRVQDIMIREIIFANQWKRPIFFAVTCSPDSRIGLDDYLWFEGLTWRLEPRKITRDDLGLNRDPLEQSLLNEPQGFEKERAFGYKFRGINDPKVKYDENTTRLMLNYRSAFIRLAMYYMNVEPNPQKGIAILDRMEQIIPRTKVPMAWELMSDIATVYHRFGRTDKFNEYSTELEGIAKGLIASGQANLQSYYNPYRVLLDIYDLRGEYQKSVDLLEGLRRDHPDLQNDAGLSSRIQQLKAQIAAQTAGTPKDSAH
jgi:hypothetical protein